VRATQSLTLPKNAGPLILAGDLSEPLVDNAILKRFVRLSGGDREDFDHRRRFSSQDSAQATAAKYAAALDVPMLTAIVSQPDESLTIPADVTGLLLIADDQSKVDINSLAAAKTAWSNGLPLLADNGGAAVAGRSFSAHGPTPQNADEMELAVQKSFLQGTTNITQGLGLLDITLEPQLLNDNRWGRLFSLAYNAPDTVAFGLTQNSALEITQEGSNVLGNNVIFALDLRDAALDLGTNAGFVIANGLLDVFVPGDDVQPVAADVRVATTPVPTPILPTNTRLNTDGYAYRHAYTDRADEHTDGHTDGHPHRYGDPGSHADTLRNIGHRRSASHFAHHHRSRGDYLCGGAESGSPPKISRSSFDRGSSIGYTTPRCTAAHLT
jgi:cyanophycinase-like exopeptidase